MSEIDEKLICSLLSRNDILGYLNIHDKRELSSSCKFIYEKCTRTRLENFKFIYSHYDSCIGHIQNGKRYGDNSYELNPEYFDTFVNKHKDSLLYLTYRISDYFLLEYFSLKFTNLYTLCLDYIMLPKNVLKNIIKNLPNLHSLLLFDIIVFYSKNDSKVDNFKFSKCLKKLEWENCGQYEVDNTDYLRIKYIRILPLFNIQNMDISLNLINTLKHLYWLSEVDDSQLLNEIISNNRKLTSLEATSRLLDTNIFHHISNNSNLTRLSISFKGFHLDFDNTHLLKLSNIKTLTLYRLYDKNCDLIDIIIENCNNLEELDIDYYVGFERSLKHFINVLENLKILSIYNNDLSLAKVYTALRHSNLEQLKIGSRNPIRFKANNFNNFNRMKKLKFIDNYHLKASKIPKYDELNNWRIIKYPTSTQYWKIN